MALDKSRTSPFVKTMIIILAISFVAGIGFTGVVGLSSCSTNTALLPGSGTGTPAGSVDTTAAIQAIDARFTPVVAAREASLTADPKNYDILLAQANDYYDWALQITQTAGTITDEAAQVWTGAATYYSRAVEVRADDPNVLTDYSIALFYSGDADGAIKVGEQTRKDFPTFSPVVYNLGVFYYNSSAADAKIKAAAAFQAYLTLDPSGNNAANAKQFLSDIGSIAATSTGQ